WIPTTGWLTKVAVDGTAGQLRYDLAIDASGAGRPSAVDAGLALPGTTPVTTPVDITRLLLALGFVSVGLVGIGLVGRSWPGGRPLASGSRGGGRSLPDRPPPPPEPADGHAALDHGSRARPCGRGPHRDRRQRRRAFE